MGAAFTAVGEGGTAVLTAVFVGIAVGVGVALPAHARLTKSISATKAKNTLFPDFMIFSSNEFVGINIQLLEFFVLIKLTNVTKKHTKRLSVFLMDTQLCHIKRKGGQTMSAKIRFLTVTA
ncbi:MAG: hypothetical protein IPG80_14480 [Anaerolineales bacterium]|uniref:hypothetical protein n=1 Tax=Candidatus Villigracilis vicinus TaxID=3140679 RepID=UPI003135FB82|nr:hypothetical protein [Anaerolineales bacterium]